LLNTCPHHGFETWRLVSLFYEGLTPKDRQMVELMCNGTFKDKDPNEAMENLNLVVENAQNWDTTSTYEAPSKINLIHLVEECTTLGKIMTSKLNLHL
jgi:proteasome assembly chaperone (PAC2) family protein